MHTYTYNSLFSDPFFIGFDRLTSRLSDAHANATGFPPYNVRKDDEDTFVVELAIAGFGKEDIKITEHEGTLKIEGAKEDSDTTYVHKGIAGRKFTRSFALGEYMVVEGADMADGMLYITVKRQVPEEKKPKHITIK